MLLGAIADDLTGATDLALMLARSGLSTVQIMGVPEASTTLDPAFDAVVIALKSRTNPPDEAVAWSLAALDVLLANGARQILFKYCSTFDSTSQGNIGPVADALSERLGSTLAVVCPAFPANKRTIYMGNLFVGEVPLAESPMKDHPLTPMRDSSLVRLMQGQSRFPVGVVALPVIEAGSLAIGKAFEAAAARGERYVVTDAIHDAHLIAIGAAAADHRLITGGSGIAMGLAANFERAGLVTLRRGEARLGPTQGRRAILAGSCSQATRAQVAAYEAAGWPAMRLDPAQIARGEVTAAQTAAWAQAQPDDRPVLIYSSDAPENVARVQAALGRERAGALIEALLADTAEHLVAAGFGRFIIAGGETSGAVVGRLGVSAIEIGPEIDPGVPWTRGLHAPHLALALKSGNFGAEDFFLKAWDVLARSNEARSQPGSEPSAAQDREARA